MRELTLNEVQEVNGGGWLADLWDDAKYIVRDLPNGYQDAITAAADMMCVGTGNCEA